MVLLAADLSAQTVPPPHAPPARGMSLSADVLRDLPNSANLFAILETTQPELIADRFNSGGLNVGESSRLGGFLASSTQTQYRLGDLDISGPIDGAPLFFPEATLWDRVDVTTGLMPAELDAPGLAVSLEPPRPTDKWTGEIEASWSGGRLIADPDSHAPPSSVRLADWAHGRALAGVPLREGRLGLTIGAAWWRNETFARARPTPRRGAVRSAFVAARVAPAPGTEWRTFGWVQRAQTPTTRDVTTHAQATYQRSAPTAGGWRIFGGFTTRNREREPLPAGLVVERLEDGPIPALVAAHDEGVERRGTIGVRVSPLPANRRHVLQVGAAIDRASASSESPSFAGVIDERVNGLAARVWSYVDPDRLSHRTSTTLAIHVSDRILLSPQAMLDLGLRFEAVHGAARDAVTTIRWRTLTPAAVFRWTPDAPYNLTFFTGFRRAANRLLLGLLSYGDPAAPSANVFRWDAAPAFAAAPIARVGPGTGGDPTFSRIDPKLRRPYTDEFVIGLESRPRSHLRFAIMGMARRQSSLVNVVNTGVGADSYATFVILDDNVDLLGRADDHELTVYNRQPESFGRDRYLLTNPDVDDATMGALVVTAQATTDRLFLLIGATASAAVGPGGNRGFRAIENDQDVPGELFTNPNASTFSRGRLFSDRAYVIKWTTVYRFPHAIRLGAIARYQDGQPFSRMVIAPDLNQGPEAIQAFANGRSRFAFTGTLDLRLQKEFLVGGLRAAAILDAYNVLNLQKEVEEYVVTGSRFRDVTAIQPPRALHLVLRLSF